MRDAFARSIYEAAKRDARIIMLVADISPAGAMEDFRREFPDRFINVGIAEQAMIGLAAGLAQRGFKPFCYTIATFALLRPYEFIRDDLAYQGLPVVVVGMGAGLNYPTLGGTHQAVDDVAAALAIPNLRVLTPSCPADVSGAIESCLMASDDGYPMPTYLRLGKSGEVDLPGEVINYLGSRIIQDGTSGNGTCLLACGPIAAEAVAAARGTGLSIWAATELPMRPEAIEAINQAFAEVVVVEEASGAPLFANLCTALHGSDVRVRSICLPRRFDHMYGSRAQLLRYYGLSASRIGAQLHEWGLL